MEKYANNTNPKPILLKFRAIPASLRMTIEKKKKDSKQSQKGSHANFETKNRDDDSRSNSQKKHKPTSKFSKMVLSSLQNQFQVA